MGPRHWISRRTWRELRSEKVNRKHLSGDRLESIACRKYYLERDPSQIGADGQVREEQCKVKDVQTELAAVKGYMEFFDGLLSMPYLLPISV